MAGKREKPEDIVSKLRQVEVLQGQGATVAEAVRQIGVTQQTFYRWRKLYGGGGGIRTHGTLSRSTVFKTAAFDHSATPLNIRLSFSLLGIDNLQLI